jgi:hypothetical protein
LKCGVQPLFRNRLEDIAAAKKKKSAILSFFPENAIVRKAYFVFSGKLEGAYKLAGVKITFGPGEEPY